MKIFEISKSLNFSWVKFRKSAVLNSRKIFEVHIFSIELFKLHSMQDSPAHNKNSNQVQDEHRQIFHLTNESVTDISLSLFEAGDT